MASSASKAALRGVRLAARAALDGLVLAEAAVRIEAHLLAAEAMAEAGVVAAYVPLGPEPGSLALLDRLRDGGTTVLLPVLRADRDLDWVQYDDAGSLREGPYGLRQPAGEPWGRAAVASAHVVLVPALAVDRSGHRLGRGGGSYDRALARVPASRPVVALLHDGELLADVPAEPHDRPVTAAVTPSGGLVRLRPAAEHRAG